jgi:hypothetical protein
MVKKLLLSLPVRFIPEALAGQLKAVTDNMNDFIAKITTSI